MPSQENGPENGLVEDSSTWAERSVLVVGAATGMGQAVVTAFAAAGAGRIALVDSGDMSVTRYRAYQAAAANEFAPPDLLTLHLEAEASENLDEKVDEVSRRWGHVDLIVNHAIHELFFVEHSRLHRRIMENDRGMWFQTGFKNTYTVIEAFIPLLLSGSEKTFINIIPDVDSSNSKPELGANMIAELANRQMADCLIADHGHKGLLAYSIHSSRSSNKDSLKQLELHGSAVVYLATTRRDWLAGRHISSTQDARELVAQKDVIVRDDLLRYKESLSFDLPSEQPRRARVPRSSY